ncbi:hypothetical protein GUJ93_ZPchr0010g11115 [Zizania palustris]|uniref:[RNA-polymerase]-subunit kinase n=1 Tax=Zizania palustris TaxID=103762 RepID=A0A8J5WDM1_ZIZPA|nr:hypothetical protein GUJ93_ZPchr0010g9819 [Zizania palustris]KAG8088131.1 hypothetical protein GUJ93_ZPchr0010g11115 [Zizania palustris]
MAAEAEKPESRKRPAAEADPEPRPCGSGTADGAKRRRYVLASADDYEKLDVVGHGAFGVVFKARDRRTGKKVALKRLHGQDEGGYGAPDFDAVRVEAACQTACRGHPSIVEIKDVVGDGKTGEIFLVMEFVGDGNLRDKCYRSYSADLTRVMMRQLIDAAKKMHSSRVIHRDIKPENVLVSVDGTLKICDFGAATLMKPAGKPYGQCLVGTLTYTSPEQLAGNRCYGPAVDMWALGCIMGELLTGAPLFGGYLTEKELLAELSDHLGDQITELFDLLPKLSPAGRELLTGLLAFDPEKRLTAAEALEHRWFSEEDEKTEFAGYVPLFG